MPNPEMYISFLNKKCKTVWTSDNNGVFYVVIQSIRPTSCSHRPRHQQAFAKLLGSYAALEGGIPEVAFQVRQPFVWSKL